MAAPLDLYAVAPQGVETLLADELTALGATDLAEQQGGVTFVGGLEMAYRACLWSRLATRVLLPLAHFDVADANDLYDAALEIPWRDHVAQRGTLAVDVSAAGPVITHSQYAAHRVKDAVIDYFRRRTGSRPSVDVNEPDVRINVQVRGSRAMISIDLSGASLHRRGYREREVASALKENLAATVLVRAQWPRVAAEGGSLIDPLCGSGTIPIEAALMAGDIAPGLLRTHFGFLKWRGHAPKVWRDLRREAELRRERGLARIPRVVGYDADPSTVYWTERHVARAGLTGRVQVACQALSACSPGAARGMAAGLVITYPPYRERRGDDRELEAVYATLGNVLRRRFQGFRAFVLTSGDRLPRALRLQPERSTRLHNGSVECTLLDIPIVAGAAWEADAAETSDAEAASCQNRGDAGGDDAETGCAPVAREPMRMDTRAAASRAAQRSARPTADAAHTSLSSREETLRSRLVKSCKRLQRWARKEGITCYRLYDADLPEYGVALDLYEDWLLVQEYPPPSTMSADRAEQRLKEVLQIAAQVVGIPVERIFVKVRRRQPRGVPYEVLGRTGQMHEVCEGGHRFLVSFTDRLDTGLALDHRNTRALVARLAADKDFLHLFGDTATATVYAAKAGARSTTTVDLSNTCLAWARRNLELNGITGDAHALVRADGMTWLAEAASSPKAARFDVVFADAPTSSDAKQMTSALDIQRDHVELVQRVTRLLRPDGVFLLANQEHRFKLDLDALRDFEVEEITALTLPPDFPRRRRAHRCWRIAQRADR